MALSVLWFTPEEKAPRAVFGPQGIVCWNTATTTAQPRPIARMIIARFSYQGRPSHDSVEDWQLARPPLADETGAFIAAAPIIGAEILDTVHADIPAVSVSSAATVSRCAIGAAAATVRVTTAASMRRAAGGRWRASGAGKGVAGTDSTGDRRAEHDGPYPPKEAAAAHRNSIKLITTNEFRVEGRIARGRL
jgi:hypothetical protein